MNVQREFCCKILHPRTNIESWIICDVVLEKLWISELNFPQNAGTQFTGSTVNLKKQFCQSLFHVNFYCANIDSLVCQNHSKSASEFFFFFFIDEAEFRNTVEM